jgi:hypothetical protein
MCANRLIWPRSSDQTPKSSDLASGSTAQQGSQDSFYIAKVLGLSANLGVERLLSKC